MENNNSGERKRFQGNWKCGKCGREIYSLPFQPRGDHLERLQCGDCYRKSKEVES